jgi:hypothetical protein
MGQGHSHDGSSTNSQFQRLNTVPVMAVDIGLSSAEALAPLAVHQPNTLNAIPARPFAGIWTVLIPRNICLSARAGHFTALDDVNHVAYVGYGTSPSGAALTNLWALDLRILKWRQISLQGTPMPPHNASRVVVVGGFFAGEYIPSLYIIDSLSAPCATSGDIPSPRSAPIMAVSDDGGLFVWGGYNNQWPSEIHILDLRTRVWTMVPSIERGGTAVPAVVVANRILSYGGSNHSGIWALDMTTSTISIINATGARCHEGGDGPSRAPPVLRRREDQDRTRLDLAVLPRHRANVVVRLLRCT